VITLYYDGQSPAVSIILQLQYSVITQEQKQGMSHNTTYFNSVSNQ